MRADVIRDPVLRGEDIPQLVCDLVDMTVDYVGNLGGVSFDFVGYRRQLSCSVRWGPQAAGRLRSDKQ